MTGSEAVKTAMVYTDSSLKYLEDYADEGSRSNICQKLARNMKVSSLVNLLECMGYQLMAINDEGTHKIIIDE